VANVELVQLGGLFLLAYIEEPRQERIELQRLPQLAARQLVQLHRCATVEKVNVCGLCVVCVVCVVCGLPVLLLASRLWCAAWARINLPQQ
jgi:hypothetical protein